VRLIGPFRNYIPKHHIVYHILEKSRWFGNPKMYACWMDESWNKQLKGCCRNVSQATFEVSNLFSMRDLLRPADTKARKRKSEADLKARRKGGMSKSHAKKET